LREALLNALIHKDYSSGNPVQVSVYEDNIIFWNAGKLPEQLTLDMLQTKHPSILFNPLIASTFFRAGFIEAWGRGIEKINNECELANVPLPKINFEFGGMMLKFYVAKNNKSVARTAKRTKRNLEETSEKILKLIHKNSSITIHEMVNIIGVSQRSIERNLKKLQIENKLKRIGADIGGYWELNEI
jgi:ATP-dependent DNA helicase RecG